jgi:membrane protein implicated in regulation of membrane protease activity
MVNTSQQIGGSVGTALLNTLAATAAADYLAAHLPPSAAVAAEAAIHSYDTAYWWGAGFFAFGGVLAALLFRRLGHGISLANPHATSSSTSEIHGEPVTVH